MRPDDAVESAIRRTCRLRDWQLHALNVRTNHVHVVLTAPGLPEPVMTSHKAWASRGMIDLGLCQRKQSRWTDHGSTRYLWSHEAIEWACDYVLNRQGDDLD
jgi:REP element-mobilizing transposase RayT